MNIHKDPVVNIHVPVNFHICSGIDILQWRCDRLLIIRMLSVCLYLMLQGVPEPDSLSSYDEYEGGDDDGGDFGSYDYGYDGESGSGGNTL